ncbi:hypothetical protein BU25DRAFT_335088 [Macroventuria anomochaeta]|uniref:Uncharacterized protein n=1 Tax=Macroventuria anomochaeta TaxID=301207 RepID=A0ACB6S8S6_9PLEO|nr:uncharacterized protein BU25DRAFT_335088 [Macroventuria anomochaeta]KAF2630454.1 hypothetical protein BU25DRAFT_335088 [Macroventuria anomochaeta]
MELVRSETQYHVVFPDGTALGEMNLQLEEALNSILEQQYSLEFEVFAPTRAIRETISKATKEKDAISRVQVNVYGTRAASKAVGRELSQRKIYLQRPECVRNGAVYNNPHFLKLGDHEATVSVPTSDVVEPIVEKITGQVVKEAITNVYCALTRGQNLVALEGDRRLRTPLLSHQKRALDFMSQRENGPIPSEYLLWKFEETEGQSCYRHAVTGMISRLQQTETGGGILADEMGMVVASSDLMINEWLQELDKHFDDNTKRLLKCVKYHGPSRERSLEELRDTDIVITTYHTLASDASNTKNSLQKIEWYRLVLDEAHIIRRQNTGLHRTVAEIAARSRWCLTGTPVQNRLEDIGSLLAFLRLKPFHNLSNFKKSIAFPFDEGGRRRQLAIERFTLLLDSVCLRRTKNLLHLPDQQNRVRNITLSPEERSQYDQTSSIMFRAVRNQAEMLDQNSTLGMFQVQLQLRILCNHGTWQQPFSWNRRKLHLLDEREAVEASLGRDGEATCSACRQTLPLFGTGSEFRRYADCRHILCSECVDESMPSGENQASTRCPLCVPLWRPANQGHRPKQGSQEDTYFRTTGRSSKIEALMCDVIQDVWVTKRHVSPKTSNECCIDSS